MLVGQIVVVVVVIPFVFDPLETTGGQNEKKYIKRIKQHNKKYIKMQNEKGRNDEKADVTDTFKMF